MWNDMKGSSTHMYLRIEFDSAKNSIVSKSRFRLLGLGQSFLWQVQGLPQWAHHSNLVDENAISSHHTTASCLLSLSHYYAPLVFHFCIQYHNKLFDTLGPLRFHGSKQSSILIFKNFFLFTIFKNFFCHHFKY